VEEKELARDACHAMPPAGGGEVREDRRVV
jgi:hypothetical protein